MMCSHGFRIGRPITLLLGVLSVLALTACAGNSSPPRYYHLAADSAPMAGIEATPVTLGLWPVELPDLLNRSGIVSYEPQHQVRISTSHTWAGALDENIGRVISTHLVNQLGLEHISSYPWDSRQKPAYQLRIRVESLAGPLQGPVDLAASWSLRSGADNRWIAGRRVTLQQAVDGAAGYDGYVAALNGALNRFSRTLVSELAPLLKAADS